MSLIFLLKSYVGKNEEYDIYLCYYRLIKNFHLETLREKTHERKECDMMC
jgi:hypothetical protein